MDRGGAAGLQRACVETALAPVPTFLGGSCPLGTFPSDAPATGGLSMDFPRYIRYAAGSEKGKRAGCPLHGDTLAQSFLFCKGGGGGAGGEGSWFRPAPLSRPLRPPTFLATGGLAVPRQGLRPLHPAWGRDGRMRVGRGGAGVTPTPSVYKLPEGLSPMNCPPACILAV